MSIYLNKATFPIPLFNWNDNKKFNSFKNIETEFNQTFKIRDYRFYLTKILKENEKQHLFNNLITVLFPYLFFSKAGVTERLDFKDYNFSEAGFSIHDKEKFLSILNLRIDCKLIIDSIDRIKSSKDVTIRYSNFISQLFIVTYKYAYIHIADSIYWSNENGVNEKMTFKMLLDERQEAKEVLSKESSHKFKISGAQTFIKNLDSSISKDKEERDKIIENFEWFIRPSDLSKILYSIIDMNIIFNVGVADLENEREERAERNKLLLPLFQEIVSKICYPEYYQKNINDSSLKQDFRNFLKRYRSIKNL